MQSSSEAVWVPASDGYELSLTETGVTCRDKAGQECVPIPAQVLACRAYPAWALITDPENAAAALAVVDDLKRAAGKAPHDAMVTYEWVARRLPVGHLPVFWEHAGRQLAAARDTKRAAMAFGRAREFEEEHGLPVDGDSWLASHREFAAAGAISAKAAGQFGAALRDRYAPEPALAALIELAELRTRYGQPPWPELPRQLAAAARAAGRDVNAEQQHLIERLLPLSAIRETPVAVWKAWRPALIALAKGSTRNQRRLLDVFPVADRIDGWWFELLNDTGALDLLACAPAIRTEAAVQEGVVRAEPAQTAARWLSRAVIHARRAPRDRVYRTLPRQFGWLIAALSARLVDDDIPVRLHGTDYGQRAIDVRVLETCLANGVPVAAPAADAGLDFHVWLSDRDPEEDIPALVADPVFAPLLRKSLDRHRDRIDLERVPALRRMRQSAVVDQVAVADQPAEADGADQAAGAGTEPASAGTVPADETTWHLLDDAKVPRALYGLSERWAAQDRSGSLRGIQLLGDFLTGAVTTDRFAAETKNGVPVTDYWVSLIGRIGAVALRAVAASTRDERRARLLALLEVWAQTPFAGPEASLRIGVVATEQTGQLLTREEYGAAVAVGWAARGQRRFVELRTGAGDVPAATGDPSALGTVVEVADAPRGWGGADALRRLVALVRERGPVPYDDAAVSVLAERTGLSRPAAGLILAGIPGTGSYSLPFLDETERKILRLKTAEAEAGRRELGVLSVEQRLDLLADVLPADPAELWEPGRMSTVAERVAQRWNSLVGRRVSVPEATLTAAMKLPTVDSTTELCVTLAEPHAVASLTTNLDTWIKKGEYGYKVTDGDGGTGVWRFGNLLRNLAIGAQWAYAELPAGDPVRAGVPDTVELLRARLSHPGLLLNAGSAYYRHRTEQELRARFGDKPYHGPEPLDVATIDDGLTVVTLGGTYSIRGVSREQDPNLFFRPAFYGDDTRSEQLRAMAWSGVWDFTAVQWLLSEECGRMVARIRSGALPDGAYEAYPLVSVPELVAEVGQRLDLAPDPAALYLELLTLLQPTDRNIRTWNGWTPTRHKAAVAALVERALVVEAKRARAGRGVFLPGGWAKADTKHLPLESWKVSLYGLTVSADGSVVEGVSWPKRPLTELYVSAWQRILDGDQPR
ncbi:hypothetical protein ACWDV4_10900 [Micromonospora sp. NPDC003197]